MSAVALSVEEYLNTHFEYAPDYVEGELEDRVLPGFAHSRTQVQIGSRFVQNEKRTGLYCYPEQHLQVAKERYRIADLAIFRGRKEGLYPAEPALAVIEILSPLDSLAKALVRLKDYQGWGVAHLWLIDSENQVIYRFDGRRLHPVDAIEFTDPPFRMDGAELFASINS